MNPVRIFAAAAAVTVALVAWVPVASAALAGQIFLDPAGTLFSGCTAPCPIANIDITLINGGADANVTFTALSNAASGFSFLLGGVGGAGGPGGNIVGLDIFPGSTITSPSVSVTSITPTYKLGSAADTGGGVGVKGVISPLDNVDGIGSYNLFLTWLDGAAHGSNDLLSALSFTLHNTSGTWGCVKEFVGGVLQCANPLIENDLNNKTNWTNMITGQSPFASPSWAGAHVSRCFTASLPDSCGSTGVVTAFAGGAATTNDVPEPGTLALLGSGVILVGALARRFRK